jgi:hypothetical protein
MDFHEVRLETGAAHTEIAACLADIADLIRVPENPGLVIYIAPELVHRLSPFLPMRP